MMQISDLEIKAIGQCVLISACDAFVLETRCLPRNNPCIRFLFSAFAANLSPSLLIFWLFLLVRAPYTIHLLKQSSLVKQFHATAHIQRGSFLRSFWRSDVDSLQPLWGKKKKHCCCLMLSMPCFLPPIITIKTLMVTTRVFCVLRNAVKPLLLPLSQKSVKESNFAPNFLLGNILMYHFVVNNQVVGYYYRYKFWNLHCLRLYRV